MMDVFIYAKPDVNERLYTDIPVLPNTVPERLLKMVQAFERELDREEGYKLNKDIVKFEKEK